MPAISTADPQRDCQEIVRHLATVVFPWDTTRSLELALFRTFASVRIGGLLVKHGDRHNEHVSKSMLEDAAYQVSIMAGHVHRLNQFGRTGHDFHASACTSGCLCLPVPSYMASKGRKPRRKWEQGTALARVDMKSSAVWLENLRYSSVGKHIGTTMNGEWVYI